MFFSCRMRSAVPNSVLPQVTLSVNTDPLSSNSVTPPYTTLDSWQWVTMEVNFTAKTDTNITVSVTMETYEVNDVSESVYFDDFCLQVITLGDYAHYLLQGITMIVLLVESVTPSSSTQATIPSSMPTESNTSAGVISE